MDMTAWVDLRPHHPIGLRRSWRPRQLIVVIMLLAAFFAISAAASAQSDARANRQAHITKNALFDGPQDAALNTDNSSAHRPNILFILTDDLGYGQLGYTGNPHIRTPNIDRLAAQGIQFSQAYAGGPVCSPSRIALLTGKDARDMASNANSILLQDGDRTIAQLLRDAGYSTALFGKFGIGLEFGKTDPMTMGFAKWVGLMHNISAHRQYPPFIFRDNVMEAVDANSAGAKGRYAQRLFTDEALKYLDQQDGSTPFFAMLSYTAPHAELAAPADLIAAYDGVFTETPYAGFTGDPDVPGFPKYYPLAVPKPHATVAAMITALDQYVGEVLARLDQRGLADNTIVIFTSDNGAHREGGANPDATYAASPFRGEKRDLYEGGIHMPMIVRWPAMVQAPRIDDTPIAFADFAPTFAQLARIPAALQHDLGKSGQSLTPLWRDRPQAMAARTLYWAFSRQLGDPNSGVTGTTAQAARREWMKAVRPSEDGMIELYDLKADPAERYDLAQKKPLLADEFTRYFDQILADRAAMQPQ